MARVVALGEPVAVAGFGLAGAVVVPAADDASVRAAWDGLDDDVAVVILTPMAARALGTLPGSTLLPLTVVLPR